MPKTITLEAIEEKQSEVVAMIAQLKEQAAATPTIFVLQTATIALRPEERYAGAVLDEAGRVKHHLILMPAKPGKRLTWKAAVAWAQSVGGELPTRQEQALLFANCKPHLVADWHWSNEANGENYAWYCYFTNGYQNYDDQDSEGLAVAVRRLNP